MRVLKNAIVDTKTVTVASNGAIFDVWQAQDLAIVVVASAAATAVGTSVQLGVSLDGTNFTLLGSAVAATTNGVYVIPYADCLAATKYVYGRIGYAWASGSIVYNTTVCVKGEAM